MHIIMRYRAEPINFVVSQSMHSFQFTPLSRTRNSISTVKAFTSQFTMTIYLTLKRNALKVKKVCHVRRQNLALPQTWMSISVSFTGLYFVGGRPGQVFSQCLNLWHAADARPFILSSGEVATQPQSEAGWAVPPDGYISDEWQFNQAQWTSLSPETELEPRRRGTWLCLYLICRVQREAMYISFLHLNNGRNGLGAFACSC